jgi:hypothetical protein
MVRQKDSSLMPRNIRLLVILRNTLKHLEQDLGPDDPDFLRLESLLLREISELELEKTEEGAAKAA